MTVTVQMRTGVGPYRKNQLVETDPDTAAGWMSANLADLMPAPPAAAAPAELEGATDGAPARVKSPRESGRRKAAGHAVGNGVHDSDDAAGSKPVEGTNPR